MELPTTYEGLTAHLRQIAKLSGSPAAVEIVEESIRETEAHHPSQETVKDVWNLIATIPPRSK